MRKRGEGRVGRGCCGECFSPWKCCEPLGRKVRCGCHARKEPTDTRVTDIEKWKALPDEVKTALATACWTAHLERRTAA